MVVAERCVPLSAAAAAAGFHLSGRESISSASLYKQRIDSMFEETRSVISHTQGYGHTRIQHHVQHASASVSARAVRRVPSIPGRLDGPGGLGLTIEAARAKSESISNGNIRRQGNDRMSQNMENHGHPMGNSVQANIERMFSELAMETDSNDPGTHTFSVDYLGSTPLPRKVTSLAGLQAPLAKLYLAYRRTKPIGSANSGPELTARLDISKAGLHVRHCGPKGELEQLNPFPTIAVWSAVKFVLQPLEDDPNVIQFAFLPLITDPDNIDKQALFRNLDPSEKKFILGRDGNSHSPLFTVVMRKIGVAKQLECHGFVCQTSEDAIVIAATLYKSLMAHMSKVPRAKGGLTGPSIASSTAAPVRPPRRKRTPSSASGESDTRNSGRNDTLNRPTRQDSFSRNSTRSSVRHSSLSRNNAGRIEVSVEVNNHNSSPKQETPSTRSSNASSRGKNKLRRSELPGPPPPPPLPPPKTSTGIEEVKAKLASIKNGNESGSDKEKSANTPPQSIYKESMDFLNKQHNNSNRNTMNNNNPNNSQKNSTRSTANSKVSEKIEMFSSLEKSKDIPRPLTVPPPVPIKPKKDEALSKERIAPKVGPLEPLRRSHSMRNASESGDILTKVAIPRSGSFLNASGLSRYKSTGQRNNGKKGGGSPLGFSELFNEFRVQEDLHSMDDILGAIIDADGMSFNDLKPIYKEFLLKLAVTLTKDELFQHSKNIMRRQKKKLRRNSTVQNKRKKMLIGARGLKMVFRKPFGKDILKSKLLHIGESKKNKNLKLSPFEMPKVGTLKKNIIITSESSVSTSSYDLRQFHPKEKTPPKLTPKRQSVKRRNSKRSETTQLVRKTSKRHTKSNRNLERVSTSEDSDFLTLSRKMGACQNRNSSSGYVSCSECESESCADRCYCAVRVKPKPQQLTQIVQENCCNMDDKCCDCTAGDSSHCYSLCGCDTESCADSDKCYCRSNTNTITRRGESGNKTTSPQRNSKSSARHSVSRMPSITTRRCISGKCPPARSVQRSPRRRSAPGPATLDSLYYEQLRPKAQSVINQSPMTLEFMTKRNPRFDTFSRLSCSTELGGTQSVSLRGGRKSYSSDNLHVDYDMFMGQTRGMTNYETRRGSVQLPVLNHRSKEALLSHKEAEVGALFSDGRLLSARKGLYRGPSAALVDSLGYLP